MSDLDRSQTPEGQPGPPDDERRPQAGDQMMAIPRLAERVGVTPRVLRYWEEQRLISPTREHGKLRYSPRDVAIAGLIRWLLGTGEGVEGIRMLRRIAERDVRQAAATGDETALAEEALRILYQRKAFREETGTDEEHYPGRSPEPPPAPRERPPREPHEGPPRQPREGPPRQPHEGLLRQTHEGPPRQPRGPKRPKR